MMMHKHYHESKCSCYEPHAYRYGTWLKGSGVSIPALAVRHGLRFLAEAARPMERTAWLCECYPCAPQGHYGSHSHCYTTKGPHHHSRKEKWYATTDIKMEGHLGERRVVPFLVENNRSHQVSIAFRARPWIDAKGHELSKATIQFEPEKVVLEPCESVGVKAIINIVEPLEANTAYFAEFILEGCKAKPISVGLHVHSPCRYEHYATCDPCRRRMAHFVEFCHDYDCAHPHERGWHGPWDPHRHWHDEYLCNWHHLAHPRERVFA
jgi:hypothetical protein